MRGAAEEKDMSPPGVSRLGFMRRSMELDQRFLDGSERRNEVVMRYSRWRAW